MIKLNKIINFIRQYAPDGVVIGLSGGLDSSVAATLAVKALGKEKVMGFILPSASTPKQDLDDANALAKSLKINYQIWNVNTALGMDIRNIIPKNHLVRANFIARFRMCILYAHAGSMDRRVMGTSDRTELMLGYFSKYGDGAADLLPLGNLYKTEVRELARELKLPKKIIEKPSSPALWKNQTAEGEIGYSFEEIDAMLQGRIPMTDSIRARITSTEHKRALPPIPSIILSHGGTLQGGISRRG